MVFLASLSTNDLKEILLSDLTELNKVPDCTEAYTDLLTDEYFVSQIGKTDENGHWINEVFEKSGKKVDESGEVDFFPRTNPITMLSKDDENTFDKLKAELSNSDTVITRAVKTAPTSSKNASNSDAEEKREQRRAAAKAKREEQERKREEAKMELWKENSKLLHCFPIYWFCVYYSIFKTMFQIIWQKFAQHKLYKLDPNQREGFFACSEALVIHYDRNLMLLKKHGYFILSILEVVGDAVEFSQCLIVYHLMFRMPMKKQAKCKTYIAAMSTLLKALSMNANLNPLQFNLN